MVLGSGADDPSRTSTVAEADAVKENAPPVPVEVKFTMLDSYR
jgi:hypothetical protein